MNSDYRAMPPMPNPSMFPGTMNTGETTPGGTIHGSMMDTDMNNMNDMDNMGGMEMVPGGTSSGAPTPGATPGPAPSMLPGGIPGPGAGAGTGPSAGGTTSPFEIAPGAPVVLDTQYTQGYLRTQIGKRVRITFLLGTNTLQDRVGILRSVGISYVILREADTNTDVLGDMYSIKFVDIFPPSPAPVPGTT